MSQVLFYFITYRAFAETVSPAYMLFLSVPEGGNSRYNINEHSHGHKEGKDLAKKLSAYFTQVSQKFRTQSKLKDVYLQLFMIVKLIE